MNQQLDYGGFDPLFPGITIEVASDEAWSYYSDETNSTFTRDSWIEKPTPDAQFESLSIQSTYEHESRHFHDSLLIPYTAKVFAHRVRQIIHTSQLLPPLIEPGANCIPIPLARWCMLSSDERENVLQRSGRHPSGVQWKLPPKLPSAETLLRLAPGTRPKTGSFDDPEHIAWLVREAWRDQECIRELAQRAPSAHQRMPHPWQLMELSALTVQLQRINEACGSDAVLFFEDYLWNSGDNPYGNVLKIGRSPWIAIGQIGDYGVLAGIAMWCLLGSLSKDKAKACPTYRFEQLLVHLARVGPPSYPDDWWSTWDRWSHLLKLSTVAEGLKDTKVQWNHALSVVEHAEKSPIFAKDEVRALARVTEAYASASDFLISLFEQNASGYTDPAGYIMNIKCFPDPLIQHVFPKHKYILKKDDPEVTNPNRQINWAVDDGTHLNISSLISEGQCSEWKTVNIEDAIEVFNLFCTVDCLFSGASANRHDDRFVMAGIFQETKRTPFRILRAPSQEVVKAMGI